MELGVIIVIVAVLVLFAAGGYAAFTRRGSGISDHPLHKGEGDRSAKGDAGASQIEREGPPSDRGTR